MFLFGLLTILILVFELSLKQILILNNICLFLIVINILFWFKRYKKAITLGVLMAILLDLFLQKHIGQGLITVFLPIFILVIIDNLLKVESKISRIIYSAISLNFSIFISEVLFNLLYFNELINLRIMLSRMIISTLVIVIIGAIFGKFILKERDASSKQIRTKYI